MADGSEQIGQDEIEQLLKQAQSGGPKQPAPPPAVASSDEPVGQDDIEKLLSQAKSSTPAAAPAAAKPADPVEDGDKVLGQSDIEALLDKARGGAAAPAPAPKTAAAAPAAAAAVAQPTSDEGSLAPGDIELLLHKAEQALASIDQPHQELPAGVAAFQLEDFAGAQPSTETATLDLIRDVELDLKIELGRTNMYLEDVLRLRRGSVVPLDKLAGDPVDIFVNGRLIARGEVLVLNDNFCVRVAELVAGEAAIHG